MMSLKQDRSPPTGLICINFHFHYRHIAHYIPRVEEDQDGHSPKKMCKKNAPKKVFGPKIRLLRPKMGENEERSGNDLTGASEQNGPSGSSVMARLALSVVYFCNLYFFDAVHRISFFVSCISQVG